MPLVPCFLLEYEMPDKSLLCIHKEIQKKNTVGQHSQLLETMIH